MYVGGSVYTTWSSLSLSLWVDTFHYIWKTLDYYLFINFYSPVSFSFPLILLSNRGVNLIVFIDFGCFVLFLLYFVFVFSFHLSVKICYLLFYFVHNFLYFKKHILIIQFLSANFIISIISGSTNEFLLFFLLNTDHIFLLLYVPSDF